MMEPVTMGQRTVCPTCRVSSLGGSCGCPTTDTKAPAMIVKHKPYDEKNRSVSTQFFAEEPTIDHPVSAVEVITRHLPHAKVYVVYAQPMKVEISTLNGHTFETASYNPMDGVRLVVQGAGGRFNAKKMQVLHQQYAEAVERGETIVTMLQEVLGQVSAR